jgi:hypothetical protein
MRKKRRLTLFVLNLFAAGLAVVSAWLTWWDNATPMTTDFTQLLTPMHIAPTDFLAFSVAIIIFIAGGLMLLAAIFASRFLGILGILISSTVGVLWFINSGISFSFDANFWNLNKIGFGTISMFAAVIFAIVALFIPKRHEKLR